MALIIPPGFLHAVYELTCVGDPEPMVVTCGHEIDSVSGSSSADAPDDLMQSFGDEVMPIVSSQYVLQAVTTYSGNDGPTIVNTSTLPTQVGGASNTCLPPNTSYLVRKRTDLAGRRGRGRMYVPGVPEATVDHVGIVTASTVTVVQAAFTAWFEILTAGAGARLYPPVVLHRTEGIGDEPPPTPVLSFLVENKVATQRKRMRP
jgi:hypothetical protein